MKYFLIAHLTGDDITGKIKRDKPLWTWQCNISRCPTSPSEKSSSDFSLADSPIRYVARSKVRAGGAFTAVCWDIFVCAKRFLFHYWLISEDFHNFLDFVYTSPDQFERLRSQAHVDSAIVNCSNIIFYAYEHFLSSFPFVWHCWTTFGMTCFLLTPQRLGVCTYTTPHQCKISRYICMI